MNNEAITTTTIEKKEYIKYFLYLHQCSRVCIDNDKSLDVIYDLFKHAKRVDDIRQLNLEQCLYYAIYFKINNNMEKVEEYNSLADNIANSSQNSNDLIKLGQYYEDYYDRYKNEARDQAKIKITECYENAIKLGNLKGYIELGYLNLDADGDSQHIIKYLNIALEKYESNPKNYSQDIIMEIYEHLGDYYETDSPNEELMLKYNNLAISLGSVLAIHRIGEYYERNENTEKMIEYYLMAIEKNHCESMLNLSQYYRYKDTPNIKLMEKYCMMAINNHNNIEAIGHLSFLYQHERPQSNKTRRKLLQVLLKGVEFYDWRSMLDLAKFYSENHAPEEMVKCYINAIKFGVPVAALLLGDYFHTMNRIDEMIDLYTIAINFNYKTISLKAMYKLATYYQFHGLFDKMLTYYQMIIDKSIEPSECLYLTYVNLANYYYKIEKNSDLMLKYTFLAKDNYYPIDVNNYYYNALPSAPIYNLWNHLDKYYKAYPNDYSFLKLFFQSNQKDNVFHTLACNSINRRFTDNKNLIPKQNIESFCQCNFQGIPGINDEIKLKQYIVRKTNIFPIKLSMDLQLTFMEMLSISSQKCCLPKDLILHIAGYLFI